MDAFAESPRLTLQARPAPLPGQDRLHWEIDVYLNDDVISERILLKDPLSIQQKAECKWYIEEYVRVSPFSVKRARAAAGYLRGYARSIIEALELDALLDAIPQGASKRKEHVIIEVVEDSLGDENSKDTVHQLHWELLEDEVSWARHELNIVVRRSINRLLPQPGLQRVESWNNTQKSTSSVNILLVLARDLSKNTSEVDPSLASQTLIQILLDLEQTKSHNHLNLEIVRPGTLDAFKDHLQRAEDKHGPGYFHIVHFDLHGHVPRGDKPALLYFADPDSDNKKGEKASVVSKILGQHRIPIVVLNACESARANCGDNANIAKIFQRNGVNSVIAMSFEVLETAARTFLNVLYRGLLLERLTFSLAAQNARATLRALPNRYARLDLERELVDWFVPVLYTTGHESIVVPSPSISGDTIVEDASLTYESSTTRVRPDMVTQEHPAPKVLGRDLTLLKFEKKLLAHKTVYFHGRAGVGKSTFLRHASFLWSHTGFFDTIVYLDLGKDAIRNATELAEAVLRQLLSTADQKHSASLWGIEERSLQSYDIDTMIAIITHLMSEVRMALIFDGLHISHNVFGAGLAPDLMHRDAVFGLNNFLKSIIASSTKDTFFVFADRRTDPSDFSTMVGCPLQNLKFELDGLNLSDSLELARSILSQAGLDMTCWEHADEIQLELVLSLLQNIPGALHQILPQATTLHLPWRQFYDFLHRGAFSMHASLLESSWLSKDSFYRETKLLFKDLPDTSVAPIAMQALYWHEGPFAGPFIKDMTSRGFCRGALDVQFGLMIARDWGLLDTQPLNRTSWIHPLFTIYGRIIACELAKTARDSASGSTRAAQLAVRILTGATSLTIQPGHKSFVCAFFRQMDLQSQLSFASSMVSGIEYHNLLHCFESGLQNVITCINFCLGLEDVLSFEEWPQALLLIFTEHIRHIGTPAQCTLFAERYGQLVDSFLRKNDGIAVDPKHQGLILAIVNYLSTTYKIEVPISKKEIKYVQLAYDILTASEAKYGNESDPVAKFHKVNVFKYRSNVLLESGLEDEAQEARDKMEELQKDFLGMDGIGEQVSQIDQHELGVLELGVKAVGGPTAPGQKTLADILHTFPNLLRAQANMSGKTSWELRKAEQNHKMRGEDGEILPEYAKKLKKHSRQSEKIVEHYRASGIRGFDNNKMVHVDVLQHFDSFEDPLERLAVIENSNQTGDLATAAKHHAALMSKALSDFEYDEALEHLRALQDISKKDPSCLPNMNELLAFGKLVQMTRPAVSSMFPKLDEPFGDGSQKAPMSAEEVEAVVETGGLPTEYATLLNQNREILSNIGGPGNILTPEIAEKYGWTQERFKGLVERITQRARRDPSFGKKYLSSVVEANDAQSKCEEAAALRDWETALQHITRLEALSKMDFVGQILQDFDAIDVADLRTRREKYESEIKFRDTVHSITNAIKSNDFAKAHVCLKILTELQQSEQTVKGKATKLAHLISASQLVQFSEMNAELNDAISKRMMRRALQVVDQMVAIQDRGGFANLTTRESLRQLQRSLRATFG